MEHRKISARLVEQPAKRVARIVKNEHLSTSVYGRGWEQGRAKIEIRQKHFNFVIMCASVFLKHSCELWKIDLEVASIPPFWWTTSLFAFLTGPYKSLGYKGYLHVNFQIIYQLATAKYGF